MKSLDRIHAERVTPTRGAHPSPAQPIGYREPLRRAVAWLALAFILGNAAVSAAQGSSKASEPTRPLRIAFQKGAINLSVLKQRGELEKRHPHLAVSWIEFPAGPQLLEALSVGSADIGVVGDTPPIFAQAAGKDLLYVGSEPPKPDSSAILVAKNSPVRTLADLKGKRIAFQKGSSAHYLTIRALDKAGLSYQDIDPAYLPPADARAAFERGAVAAWAIWDPYFAAAELAGNARVLTTGRELSANNSFYMASRSFVSKSADLIALLFDELTRNDLYGREHRTEVVALFAAFAGLDVPTVTRVLERRPPSPVTPVAPASIDEQQKIADTFLRLGVIPRAIKVADVVWRPDAPRPVSRP